jgi:rare lipoprotein A
MKSNASAIAALLALAGAGGTQAFANQTAPGASYAVPGREPSRQQAAPRIEAAQEREIDPAAGLEGPRGSSQRVPGEQRYDEVGYAAVEDPSEGVTGVHASLPVGTLVELTSLDTGRTIVALVSATDPGAAKPITLSAGAARELGKAGSERVAVRVRKVAPGRGDLLALQAGRPAAARPDTPPVLLNALRKHLGAAPMAAAPVRPAPARAAAARPAPRPAAVRPATGGFYVQIAALSNAANAQALARRISGSVKQGGGLHRVQLGPFATRGQADAARAGAARAGHKDARVIAVN